MSEQKSLGRYIILGEQGEGGFAKVYSAMDTLLEREVALKVLNPVWANDPNVVNRFMREARQAARLNHPNIVTIHDVGRASEADGRLFIAMALVPGRSLQRAVASDGLVPFERAMLLLEQIASALDYAHQQGLVHRDIKPANILLDESDPNAPRALLTDFGLVRAAEQSVASTSISVGGILGTPEYIAPEIWDGQTATVASDVYALACVVHYMLSGQVLFSGPTPMAVLKRHLDGPALPQPWPPGVPAGVTEVLQLALRREPGRRLATAGELVARLRECQVQAAKRAAEQLEQAARREAGRRAAEQAAQNARDEAARRQAQLDLAQHPAPAVAPGTRQEPGARPATPVIAPIRPRPAGTGAWFGWIVATGAGWMLCSVCAVPTMLIGSALASTTSKEVSLQVLGDAAGALIALIGLGLACLATGWAQWYVIRDYVQNADRWITATAVGTLIGLIAGSAAAGATGAVIGLTNLGSSRSMTAATQSVIVLGLTLSAALTGFIIGLAQWLVLRRQFRWTGWWIPTSALSWMAPIALTGLMTFVQDKLWLLAAPCWILIIHGTITATVLVWLLRHPGADNPKR